MTKKCITLKEEIDKITFECSKCGCNIFKLNIDNINGYGELCCPMCYSSDVKVIFLNYKKIERK